MYRGQGALRVGTCQTVVTGTTEGTGGTESWDLSEGSDGNHRGDRGH